MSKHTVFVEAPPFAKFSDAEMRRLLGEPGAPQHAAQEMVEILNRK